MAVSSAVPGGRRWFRPVDDAVDGGSPDADAIDRDWLGRVTHLSSADTDLVLRRADPPARLGFAAQLVTVRAIGTFLPDPTAVPGLVLAATGYPIDPADVARLTPLGYPTINLDGRYRTTSRPESAYQRTPAPTNPLTQDPVPILVAGPHGRFRTYLGRQSSPGYRDRRKRPDSGPWHAAAATRLSGRRPAFRDLFGSRR